MQRKEQRGKIERIKNEVRESRKLEGRGRANRMSGRGSRGEKRGRIPAKEEIRGERGERAGKGQRRRAANGCMADLTGAADWHCVKGGLRRGFLSHLFPNRCCWLERV